MSDRMSDRTSGRMSGRTSGRTSGRVSGPLRRRLAHLAVAGALAAPWAVPAAGFPLTIRDDRGVDHRFDAPPRRIVTLLPSHSEAVWVLGGGERLVGVDRHTNWPPELAALPRVGGIEDVQIEAIAALRPDLVLASPASRAVDRLEALGLRVLRMKSLTHADVHRTLEALGALLGSPAAGDQAWSRLEAELAAAAARVPPAFRGRRVYFEIGGGSHAAGSTSFIGETLARLGLVNVAPATMGPFPKLNPEFVVRARPELVIGLQRDVLTMASRPGWQAVPAISESRHCGYAPQAFDVLLRPGPRLGEAAALLVDCLRRLERLP